jgi:Protein of unknown function (DUF2721)
MEISLNTPALLFPAITLLMLAYTNRFLSLAKLIRDLHAKYKLIHEDRDIIREQIKNLKTRLILIRRMQTTGIFSFFLCVLSMLFVYFQHSDWAVVTFGTSLFSLLLSLGLSLHEIAISTRALEIELKDMEEQK